jgi:hypothetical protein
LIEPERSIQLKELELLVINNIVQEKPPSVVVVIRNRIRPHAVIGEVLRIHDQGPRKIE